MTRVALLVPSLRGGGAERVMLLLANSLAKMGYDIDLVLVRAEGPYLTEVADGVRVVDLQAPRVAFSIPPLIRYLRSEKPSTMLTALSHAGVAGALATLLAGTRTRIIVSEHSTISRSVVRNVTPAVRLALLLVRWAYMRASGIVAVSTGVAEDLSRTLRIPPERITVIYNPVVTPELVLRSKEPVLDPWFADGEPPVILGVGRLTPAKGFDTLIGAFARVLKTHTCRLIILGEGELRGPLEEQVRNLGIESHVRLPGFVDNPYAYMRRAKVFVLSSVWEGLPTVLIEALACDCQVVATDCPSGPVEILDGGKLGTLVPVGDTKKLAQAIITALHRNTNPIELDHLKQFHLTTAVVAYSNLLSPSLDRRLPATRRTNCKDCHHR